MTNLFLSFRRSSNLFTREMTKNTSVLQKMVQLSGLKRSRQKESRQGRKLYQFRKKHCTGLTEHKNILLHGGGQINSQGGMLKMYFIGHLPTIIRVFGDFFLGKRLLKSSLLGTHLKNLVMVYQPFQPFRSSARGSAKYILHE